MAAVGDRREELFAPSCRNCFVVNYTLEMKNKNPSLNLERTCGLSSNAMKKCICAGCIVMSTCTEICDQFYIFKGVENLKASIFPEGCLTCSGCYDFAKQIQINQIIESYKKIEMSPPCPHVPKDMADQCPCSTCESRSLCGGGKRVESRKRRCYEFHLFKRRMKK